MEKPMPNRCNIKFTCFHTFDERCVYASTKNGTRCKYAKGKNDKGAGAPCTSTVARVNACVIYLKNSGISKEELHKMVEAIND